MILLSAMVPFRGMRTSLPKVTALTAMLLPLSCLLWYFPFLLPLFSFFVLEFLTYLGNPELLLCADFEDKGAGTHILPSPAPSFSVLVSRAEELGSDQQILRHNSIFSSWSYFSVLKSLLENSVPETEVSVPVLLKSS